MIRSLLLLVAATALAQERPAENAVAAQIADGDDKARAGKLLDALEQYQKVLDTAGDDLVSAGPHHLVRARWVVHGRIARLPAEGVALYRRRVDGQAALRWQDAKDKPDDAPLRTLVADMFGATATEDAINELATRAFLRGDFDAAETAWTMLLPSIDDDPRLLPYSRPRTDPAAIKARLLLTRLFLKDEVAVDLAAFAKEHPEARGLLAGREGKYAETLAAMLADPKSTALRRGENRVDWPTFAGGPDRRGTLATPLPYFWPDVATWTTPLPLARHAKNESPPDPLHRRALAFHPLVTDARSYLAVGEKVVALDLAAGKSSVASWPKGGEEQKVPVRVDARHTLTAANGILYARLGPAALTGGQSAPSFLLALGNRIGDTEERNPLWRLDPPAAEGTTHFEGSPAIHRDRLYVGLWRQSGGGDAVAGVACYRIDDPATVPDLAWQQWVGKAGTEANGDTRHRHALVTISGSNVVYCTDAGTVVALDRMTGKPVWEHRYSRNERPALPRYRELCPPLADGGRLYVAPADSDRLICLNAETGEAIWERDGIEVIHLLGVAKGRLVATIGGAVKGIRGFNLRTGADSGPNGWTIHDDADATFGRGLVSDDAVIWPTARGLRFLDPSDGRTLRSPIPGRFGNLCYADGVLLVTTATEVRGYVTEAKQLPERRKALDADPKKRELRVALTRSLIDAGLFAEAESLAKDDERMTWLLAERAGGETATRLYESLAKGDTDFAAAAAVRLADRTSDPEKSRQAWLAVGRQAATIRDERGIPWPAWHYAAVRLPDHLRKSYLSDDDFLGDVGPMPKGPLVRIAGLALDEPGLRIVSESRSGIVAAGERLWVFPFGESFVANDRPEVAEVDSASLVTASPRGFCRRKRGPGGSSTAVLYSADGPILSSAGRVALPAVSGHDGPVGLTDVAVTLRSVEFRYDDWSVRFRLGVGDDASIGPASQPADHNPRVESHDDLRITHDDYGVEIDRGDWFRRAWRRSPILIGRELDGFAKADNRIFVSAGGSLTGYSFETGEPLWETPLPEGSAWKVTSSPHGLVVHPTEAVLRPTDFDAVADWRSVRDYRSLMRTVVRSYDVWAARELPILLVDPATGRLKQRLTFPAAGPAAGVAATPAGIVVVTGKGCWTLAPK